MTLPFQLSPLTGSKVVPIWCGDKFQIGTNFSNVLEYSVNIQGWNDDLTFFHEETAGDHHFIDKASRDHAISQLKKYLPNKESVILEVGCSSGYMLNRLKQTFPQAIVMGSDVVTEPLEKLAQHLPNTPFFRFDLMHCPLPDNSVDGIILLNVLEHIADDVEAINQIYRILKPEGIVIIEVPAGPNLYDIYDRIMLHFRRYKLSHLNTLLKKKNFRILKKSHLGFFLYPAFWLIKKRNKRLLSKPVDVQRKYVEKNIQQTGKSKLMHQIMKTELKIGKYLSFPFGIRCLITCKK